MSSPQRRGRSSPRARRRGGRRCTRRCASRWRRRVRCGSRSAGRGLVTGEAAEEVVAHMPAWRQSRGGRWPLCDRSRSASALRALRYHRGRWWTAGSPTHRRSPRPRGPRPRRRRIGSPRAPRPGTTSSRASSARARLCAMRYAHPHGAACTRGARPWRCRPCLETRRARRGTHRHGSSGSRCPLSTRQRRLPQGSRRSDSPGRLRRRRGDA